METMYTRLFFLNTTLGIWILWHQHSFCILWWFSAEMDNSTITEELIEKIFYQLEFYTAQCKVWNHYIEVSILYCSLAPSPHHYHRLYEASVNFLNIRRREVRPYHYSLSILSTN